LNTQQIKFRAAPVEHLKAPFTLMLVDFFRKAEHRKMGQASVLTEAEIRRVFRIIETTRHAERNRVAFVLSIYAGLRVGEIAALSVSEVVTRDGVARCEIKLGAHQTKGSKGRTVVLSARVQRALGV
jgi:integrase/recombinase XerD